MTSKEELKMIKIKCHPNANPNPMIDEALNNIEKDLNRLEKQDKILERLKKPMLYRERKKLGEEFIEWAKENNVNQNDLTSVITWCFCFKMKEWLDGSINQR